MAKKHKRQKRQHHQQTQKPSKPSNIPANNRKQAPKKKQAVSHPRRRAMDVPFGAGDDLLLIGEGDFSFAQSLALHHRTNFRHLHATSLDTRAELLTKHPQAEGHIDAILSVGSSGGGPKKEQKEVEDVGNGAQGLAAAEEDAHEDPDDEDAFEGEQNGNQHRNPAQTTRISYNIDATRLPSYKPLRTHKNPLNTARKTSPPPPETKKRQRDEEEPDAPAQHPPPPQPPAKKRRRNKDKEEERSKGWDWIVFNFPHVGGKSTDVRRQVRANQELLVKFFEGAKELLRRSPGPARGMSVAARAGGRGKPTSPQSDSDGQDEGPAGARRKDGRLMITLFEGEPYTLWNIRDLARHCGYAVERSYRFEWDDWGGYRHARTLGNVVRRGDRAGVRGSAGAARDGGRGEADSEWSGVSADERAHHDRLDQAEGDEEEKRRPGKWRGEERSARSYVFYVRREEEDAANGGGGAPGSKGPKGRKGDGSDGSDE